MVFNHGLLWIPITIFLLFPITFTITYVIAAVKGHTNWFLPYISDTGATPPESCIFGQFLNIGGFLVMLIAYIRYLQLIELNDRFKFHRLLARLNTIALIGGLLCGLGVTIVGNFQETSVFAMHMVGALMAFGIGTLYLIIQTIISYKTAPITCTRAVCHLRTALSFFCVLCFINTFLFATLAGKENTAKTQKERMKWTPDMGGYDFHVVSTMSEWLLALAFIVFILTFAPEYKLIECETFKIEVAISERRLATITTTTASSSHQHNHDTSR